MKTILEYLYNRKGAIRSSSNNIFNITKKDLIGRLEGFPLGIVVRMLEEQEMQSNKPDVTVFRNNRSAGFKWDDTEDGRSFWYQVLYNNDFDLFYNKYPEYKKYDL